MTAKVLSKEQEQNISIRNTGIHNSFYGHKHTEETKARLSEIAKGRKLPEETRIKIGDAVRGEKNGFYGKKHTQETKEIMRAKATGRKYSLDVRKKLSEARIGSLNHFYGKHHIEETKRKISEAKIGQPSSRLGAILTEETKVKISALMKGKRHSLGHVMPEASKLKLRVERLGKPIHSVETRRKMSIRLKKMWQDPEYREYTIKKSHRFMSPNKPETQILEILNEMYPNEWAFVGDGQVIIEGRNPDFWNTNGQKKIIECFGMYWHGEKARCYEETEEGRIALFKKHGYKTLVIWENELKDIETVKDKIKEFVEVK